MVILPEITEKGYFKERYPTLDSEYIRISQHCTVFAPAISAIAELFYIRENRGGRYGSIRSLIGVRTRAQCLAGGEISDAALVASKRRNYSTVVSLCYTLAVAKEAVVK